MAPLVRLDGLLLGRSAELLKIGVPSWSWLPCHPVLSLRVRCCGRTVEVQNVPDLTRSGISPCNEHTVRMVLRSGGQGHFWGADCQRYAGRLTAKMIMLVPCAEVFDKAC